MEKLMDSIKWEDDFDIEGLRKGPFGEILALSKAVTACHDFGRLSDILCLGTIPCEKIAEFNDGLWRIVKEKDYARNPNAPKIDDQWVAQKLADGMAALEADHAPQDPS